MNPLKIFALLLTLSSSSFAADGLHWYEIAVGGIGKEKTLIGSSKLDPVEMSRRLAFPEPIVLENLRELGVGMYQPKDDVLRVYIVPKVILYFNEFPGDPANPAKK
ncbi:MAG TPA: hypothetical protein VGO11_23305 [Chthoniobacteraceae bacterium]|jgi:hypothetical protein|nr:hypothetical protein [Chthoniobacteraceae bacterium]